jgi:hypothetical protein
VRGASPPSYILVRVCVCVCVILVCVCVCVCVKWHMARVLVGCELVRRKHNVETALVSSVGGAVGGSARTTRQTARCTGRTVDEGAIHVARGHSVCHAADPVFPGHVD